MSKSLNPSVPSMQGVPPGLPFLKMHGLGNDFVVIDGRAGLPTLTQPVLALIADRRLGVGCDQLIVLEASNRADVRMRIFNPDGGEVEACGNATRCVGLIIARETRGDFARIETVAGILAAHVKDEEITVDMGEPAFGWAAIPLAGNSVDTARVMLDVLAIDPRLPCWFSAVNMGNPHGVFFVEDAGAHDLGRIGPLLETHPIFPQKANISLAEVLSPSALRLKVWERAAGITLACGTAACASAVAARRLGFCVGEVSVMLPGGTLRIGERDGHVIMTGPATTSFSGIIDPSLLALAA